MAEEFQHDDPPEVPERREAANRNLSCTLTDLAKFASFAQGKAAGP